MLPSIYRTSRLPGGRAISSTQVKQKSNYNHLNLANSCLSTGQKIHQQVIDASGVLAGKRREKQREKIVKR